MSNTDQNSSSGAPSHPGFNPQIDRLLARMVESGASDLHISVPSPPILRIEGRLVAQNDLPSVQPRDVQDVFDSIATAEQRKAFDRDLELDFAYSLPGRARFRVSAMRQRGSVSLAFRFVPFKVPTIDELGLPQICKELVLKPRGLLLISGAAGSGKSTTLAAMLNHLNETAERNVITIEDPIEFLFHNNKCIIRQRELGYDTKRFDAALVHALRHDPDVVVVGEMRDLPTIGTALTAAETGHLVIGTLHTIDAAQSVDRVIDMFPAAQQHQVRLQFSQVLLGVLSQVLLPRIGGGRVAAFEIMPVTPGIRKIIREGNILEILANLEMGGLEGKRSMDQALAELVKKGVVAREEALLKSSNPAKLQEMIAPTSDGRPPLWRGPGK
ncbi:MAG: type IV pilus twitching motility protein PilT [Kiritimatiellia bacterium]